MAIRVENSITAKQYDTLIPWSFYVADVDGAVLDLSGYTVKFHAWKDSTCPATDLVAETATGVTVQPTKTFTSDITTNIQSLYCVNHGLRVGMQLLLTTTTTLPTGLTLSTRYFVQRINGHNFWLCKQQGGNAIAITDAGTGTHSFAILGHVQYQPQAADVDTVGAFRCELKLYTGSDAKTIPGDNTGIVLKVVATQCDA